MKKRNLLFAATISVCFAMGVFGRVTSADAVTFNIAADETKDITAGSYTDPVKGNFGGIIINKGTLNILEGAEFVGNKAVYGGVIDNQAKLEITKAVFRDNAAEVSARGTGAMGGVIYGRANDSRITINSSKFLNNSTAKGGGGALYISKDSFLTINGDNNNGVAEFKNNTAKAEGGAIYNNNGTFNITGALFVENKSDKVGGAIYSDANKKTSVIKSSTFNNNFAKENGGAIALAQHGGTLTINNSYFTGNNSDVQGGAIGTFAPKAEINIGTAILNITKSHFTENFAKDSGGAIASYDKLYIKDTEFNNNHTTTKPDANGGGGGALFLGAMSQTILDNVTFDNNTSADAGGAIATRDSSANNKDAKLDIINSTFKNNKANTIGGALDNYFYNSESKEGYVNIANSIFDNNSAKNGGAIYNHGETDKNGSNGTLYITESTFKNNTAVQNGGAIYNANTAKLDVIDSVFTNNTAKTYGGAIFNAGEAVITSSTFENNSSYTGAIYNSGIMTITDSSINNNNGNYYSGGLYSSGILKVDNTTFNSNKFTDYLASGAIYLNSDTTNLSEITNSTFTKNTAHYKNLTSSSMGTGGAIGLALGNLNIDNTKFINNSADTAGAIYIMRFNPNRSKNPANLNLTNSTFEKNFAYAGGGALVNMSIANIINTDFKSNYTTTENNDGGGALFLGAESTTTLNNVTFSNNSSASFGGAIGTRDYQRGNNSSAKLDIANSLFINNKAKGKGGAIYNTFYNSNTNPDAVSIVNTVFNENKSGSDGGAIYNEIEDVAGNLANVNIIDSSFINNSASGKGGAIFTNSDLTVAAVTKDVVFSGNKAVDGGDIFMNKAGSTLNINTADGKSLTLASGVSGEKYNMTVNTDAANTGTVVINSAIKNATITVDNGTFHLAQGSRLENSTLTMASGTVLNTINNEVNSFGSNIILPANAKLAVDLNVATGIADRFENLQTVEIININPLGSKNITANNISINLAEAMGIDPSQMTISNTLLNQTQTILTPIRYLKGGISENGIMSFAPVGNSYKDFNPSIMASAVAAQLGGYLTQLNSYDEAFRNMDMYMLMTKKQRQAMKLRNKYAAADGIMTFDPNQTPYSNKAGWFRPYATFENVHLKGGPRVSNVAYGSFFGAESEMYDLGHGWDGMWGAYVGYNGSHQAYNGIGIYQNGGTLGAVGMAYKGNFFTGLTINAGANGAEASTMYGTDNFSMLMAGIASKTGYNIEMADGKFIIQPNFLMSYSFVNTFDYTNAAGVKINSSPLNAIQIEPGLKFIGNLKNGWQPYLGVSMVWNIMDKTQFKANDVSLPDLSVKPFVKYGIGVRKTWGERMTGFFQCYFTNGGRNGVGLQAGFRWSIGKTPNTIQKQSSTPQLKKTEIKLSSNR